MNAQYCSSRKTNYYFIIYICACTHTHTHTHKLLTHSSSYCYSYCSSQSEESFSENSLPRDMVQRKRSFRNHSHSMSLHPSSNHRRTLSAHEYEEDSDDKPPPQAWTAVGGGARRGYSSDFINYNPRRERFTDGR